MGQSVARVDAMLNNILPVSLRAVGSRNDTAVGKHLSPSPLESLTYGKLGQHPRPAPRPLSNSTSRRGRSRLIESRCRRAK